MSLELLSLDIPVSQVLVSCLACVADDGLALGQHRVTTCFRGSSFPLISHDVYTRQRLLCHSSKITDGD